MKHAPSARGPWLALALLLCGATARAQEAPLPPPGDERLFGFEFEFAGQGNRIVRFEDMPWENYEKLMREVVAFYGGDPATIRRVDFTKPTGNLERYPSGERPLFKAEWVDPRGRKWKIEPEFVASSGLDGYELVTPPLDDPREVERLLERLRTSGLVREGQKSGTHLNIDGRSLIKSNGDALALSNLIMLHERYEPLLRRLFNPVRGGGHANYFSRSLAMDHPDILAELDALPPQERTRERLEEIFRARQGAEMELQGADPLEPSSWSKLWKYRSMNLAKVIHINDLHDGSTGVVEFRMLDLAALSEPEAHRLQAEFYRRLILKAEELAARGEVVRYQPRASQPAGEDPAVFNTSQDPAQAKAEARAMLELVGVDPANYEGLIERNIRHRDLPTPSEFRGILDQLPKGRVEHNGKAFTYGFELEGTGEGFAMIAQPKDAEVRARWATMSDAAKKAYYREKVGSDRSSVPEHFDLDTERYPWLSKSWKVEYTGNWEIRSEVFESLEEATARMREVKKLTAGSGKGFHLHMRDNGVDWQQMQARRSEFADFIERSSNWVFLMRARRLGSMTALKSWSNNRFTTQDLDKVAALGSSDRHTVRVTVPSNREFIDLEIRGFTTFVDDIETLARIYTEALRTGNFGPWKHTDTRLANSSSEVKGGSLDLSRHYEEYLRTAEGREMTPEERRIFEGFQGEYGKKAKGDAREYAVNLATPLLPWDKDASLPEPLRRELRFKQEEYLRSLRFTANRVADGYYGVDLSVASEQALVEKLGLTPEQARDVVAYRRARGGEPGSPAELGGALTLAQASGVSMERLAALMPFDGEHADAKALASRLGVSEAEANKILLYRDAQDPLEALERAGLSEERILQVIDASRGLDLTKASAEELVERLQLTPEQAERLVAVQKPHSIQGEQDLVRAGFAPEEATRLLDLATRTIDLNRASQAELAELGVPESQFARIEELRQEGRDLNRLEVLQELLSPAQAERVLSEARNGLDLSKVSRARLTELGFSAEKAEGLLLFRDGLVGSATSQVNQLERAGLLTYAQSYLASDLVKDIALERAREGELTSRLGLSQDEVRRFLDLRDAHDVLPGSGRNLSMMNDSGRFELEEHQAEALKAMGVEPTTIERINERVTPVDLTTATPEELASRGLTPEEASRVTALSGTNLEKASVEALVARLGIDEAKARRLVQYRDGQGVDGALETMGIRGERLEALKRAAEGVDLSSDALSLAESGRRLGLDPRTIARIRAFRDAHALDGVEALQKAGLSAEEAARVWAELPHNVDVSKASAAELEQLLLSPEQAKLLVQARDAHEIRAFPELLEAGVDLSVLRALQNSSLTVAELNALTAEQLAERGGISLEDARRIQTWRDAHDIRSADALVRLLGEAQGESLAARVSFNQVDLRQATPEELARLGLSPEQVKAVVEARTPHTVETFPQVLDAGVDLSTLRALQNSSLTVAELNGLSAEELAQRGGISLEEARKLVSWRTAHDVNRVEVLRGLLGEELGGKVFARARANLAGDPTLLKTALGERLAGRLVNYRQAHSFKSSGRFDAEAVAKQLLEAGVIQASTAEKIRGLAGQIDLSKATPEQLKAMAERLGLGPNQATRFVRLRDAHAVSDAKVLAELLELRQGEAQALLERNRPLDPFNLKVEELVARGVPRPLAEQLMAFREAIGRLPQLDYTEIARQLRFKVKKWAQENSLAEALLNSLLPRPRPAEGAGSEVAVNERELRPGERVSEGEGFGLPGRPVAGSSAEALPLETVKTVAEVIRLAGVDLAGERAASGAADAANWARAKTALEGLQVDVVDAAEVIARHVDGRVEVSRGLLEAIASRAEALPEAQRGAFRLRVLGLIVAHEAAHVAGIRSEAVADRTGVEILERSALGGRGLGVPVGRTELRAAVDLFAKPTGASHLDGVFQRLKSLLRYGPVERRVTELERAARGEPDRLANYRRADGTLEWKRVVRDRALREGAGLAHFGMALFLKELAIVASTGDRSRIEEFFDGLLTTDFYKEYGLFVAGARFGEAAYSRYLERYVRPRFVNGILKTNLVLATGIALPQLVNGTFEGKAFAISLGSLGLSSAAVKAGVSGIKWVVDLKNARSGATAARAASLGKLARLGGWFYTAAELAVVLYLAEEVETRVHAWQDERAAREALAQAGEAFLAVANDPRATKEAVATAAATYHEAWGEYRNFLYRPLEAQEAELAQRLATLARDAKETADQRALALERVKSQPALRERAIREHGSLEAYAEHLTREGEAASQREVDEVLARYDRERAAALRAVYESGQRQGPLALTRVADLSWHLAGAPAGGAGDPWSGRSDVLARLGRSRAQSGFHAALGDVSGNRLQSYDDEARILELAANALKARGRTDQAEAVEEVRSLTLRTRAFDRQLLDGPGLVDLGSPGATRGLSGALEETGPR